MVAWLGEKERSSQIAIIKVAFSFNFIIAQWRSVITAFRWMKFSLFLRPFIAFFRASLYRRADKVLCSTESLRLERVER